MAISFGHLFDKRSYEELIAYGRGCIENAKIVIENEARRGVTVKVLDIGLAEFYLQFAENRRANYNNAQLKFDVFAQVCTSCSTSCVGWMILCCVVLSVVSNPLRL